MRLYTRGLAAMVLTSLALGGGIPGASRAVAQGQARALTKGAVFSVQPSGDAERRQGRTLLRRGKAAEALIHLERALKLFQQSGDRPGEASTHDLLGELYEGQGRYDAALEHYDAAHKLFAASASGRPQMPQAVAALTTQESDYNAQLMLAKIGHMLYRRGDIAGASAAYRRMSVKKPDTSAAGKVKRGKGLLGGFGVGIGSDNKSVSVGAPTLGGVLTLKQQLDLYRQSILYAGHELGLGRVDYRGQQLDGARKHFENVLEATGGDIPLLGKLGQTRRFRAAARTSLGDVALAQGRYGDAADLYAEASKGARKDGRLDLMWPAQHGAARSMWGQAKLEKDQKKAARLRDEALASFRQALETVEAIRQGSLRADESRTTFLATTGEVYKDASAALAEMALAAQSNSAPGASDVPATSAPLEGRALEYAAEALSIAERGRARSLLDMLSETGAEITGGVPDALVARKRENQNRQQEIAALLTGVNLGGDESKKSPEDLEGELNKLQTEYESIENEIRSANPRYAALTGGAPLTLEDIRAKVLDDETALLEYSLGDERSYLFAVTRAGATLSRLPGRAEIERQAVAFRQQVIPSSIRRSLTELVAAPADVRRGMIVSGGAAAPSTAAVASYAAAAHALYKTVVEPAAPLVKNSRLLVVADGALNYVPFHALVTSAPAAGADYSALAYLLKTNESLFAPSASVVAAVRRQRAASGGAGAPGAMLVVADPVFNPSDARAGGASATAAAAARQGAGDAARGMSFDSALADVEEGGKPAAAAGAQRGALVRLAGTRAEAEQIVKLAASSGRKADKWLDLDASESKVEEQDLRQYGVLHFATHGLLNAERPQFTGVVLSLVGNREGEDGFLRTDEVFNLRLGSPLVMLSACETGLGKEKRGEGVIGLTRAFMYAGAHAVGVSLWSVADKSTADLMTDFYKNLLSGTHAQPTSALRAARANMIAGKKYSAPYHWAPFVLVGDWK